MGLAYPLGRSLPAAFAPRLSCRHTLCAGCGDSQTICGSVRYAGTVSLPQALPTLILHILRLALATCVPCHTPTHPVTTLPTVSRRHPFAPARGSRVPTDSCRGRWFPCSAVRTRLDSFDAGGC